MGNIAVGEIRPSMTLIYNNELYTVIDCTHVKVARGSASCRVKMKNLKTGQTILLKNTIPKTYTINKLLANLHDSRNTIDTPYPKQLQNFLSFLLWSLSNLSICNFL